MPPRKTAKTIRIPEKAILDQSILERIRFMSDGITDKKALAHVLTQRALTAIALANEEFAKAGKGDVFGPAIEKDFAGAALGVWDMDGCVGCLRQQFVNYKLTPPEDRLAVWLKMAREGIADVILPDGFDPFKARLNEAPAPDPEVLTSDDLTALDQDNRDLGALQAAYDADRDLANQMLGEARMAAAIGKFAETVSLAKLAQVKENKLYRNLPNGLGTWEGFCAALGMSRSTADEKLQNLTAFGAEAMEALTQAGAGIRQLRAMRALPGADCATFAAKVAAAKNKEEVLDILDEALAEQAAKVEELEKTAADRAADLDAKDRVLADKGKRLDKAEHELAKLKSLPAAESLRLRMATEKEAAEALNAKAMDALAALNELLAHVEEILAADVSQHTRTYAEDTVRLFSENLADLLAKHGINVDFEGTVNPAWDQAAAKTENKAAGAK